MKKAYLLVLCLLLAFPSFPAHGETPGETAEVSFSMLTDPGDAYMITMVLEYDHEALELVPNKIFDRDRKVALFNENLSAVFRIREDARVGTYPVIIRAVEASDANGSFVQIPTYSEAAVTVKHPPVEVPVYYIDAATGGLLTAESVTLPADWTGVVTANAPEGWIDVVGQGMQVTVSGDGRAMPPVVTFWLATPSPTPTTAPTPTPTPAPVKEPIRLGGYVTFGSYEQDNDTGNGKEPIEWLVLEVRGETALLISRYALDCKLYNTKSESVTWETCSLRKWLNGEFLNSAFSVKERQAIQWTTVDNSASQGYSGYSTNGGKDTEDRIFLLSYAEAWRYFGSDSARECEPTKYAAARGAYKAGNGNCWWWLRSPGLSLHYAALVYSDGSLSYFSVNSFGGCVRPALWVDLTSDIF